MSRAGPAVGPEAVQVDHDALLAAAGDDHHRLLLARVLLPVRHEGWHEDVVARPGLQPYLVMAPGEHERRRAGQDVDRGLGLAMMVVAGPGAGRHVRLTHPDLLRSGVLPRDGLAAGHPRSLAGVPTKLPAAYVDERLVPAVFGHHASNYLLNRAIISDTIAM